VPHVGFYPTTKEIAVSDRSPDTGGNNLIDGLPNTARKRFLASCELVELAFDTPLAAVGDPIRHVYFPTSSYISLITPIDGAAALEVGLVGSEGMHGVSLMLGVNVTPLNALVQGDGPALRMKAAVFQTEYRSSRVVQGRFNHYLFVLMSQLAQSAACARYHHVEARLARWLLMTQDRAHSDRFHITHRFLAWMLGMRRASVTEAAGILQKKGLVTYKRGEINVLNRRGLEACACSCYRTDLEIYERFMGGGDERKAQVTRQ
jgi:CRP-like cAMP-binding protein